MVIARPPGKRMRDIEIYLRKDLRDLFELMQAGEWKAEECLHIRLTRFLGSQLPRIRAMYARVLPEDEVQWLMNGAIDETLRRFEPKHPRSSLPALCKLIFRRMYGKEVTRRPYGRGGASGEEGEGGGWAAGSQAEDEGLSEQRIYTQLALEVVLEKMRSLPREQALCLQLWLTGMTYKEIQRRVSTGRTQDHIYRGIQKLRLELGR